MHKRSATYWSQEKNWIHPCNSEAKLTDHKSAVKCLENHTADFQPWQCFSLILMFQASASTGHCSNTLGGKWSLSLIICPDSMCFIQTSLSINVYNIPVLLYLSCEISSWALYSSLLFNYKTTRSRNHNNCGQNSPGSSRKIRWPYWIKSPSAELSFSRLTDLCIQSERRGCTVLPPVPWPAAISPRRPRPTLSGRLEFFIFHKVQFYFFWNFLMEFRFHHLVCLDVFRNGPAWKLASFSSHSKPFSQNLHGFACFCFTLWHTKAHLWHSWFF